jgi:hypothetical protein
VGRCLAFLVDALRDGDTNVVNLVQVSFVENVGPFIGDVAELVQTWSPALRADRRSPPIRTDRVPARLLRWLRPRAIRGHWFVVGFQFRK